MAKGLTAKIYAGKGKTFIISLIAKIKALK
jgi:hypothetical protein